MKRKNFKQSVKSIHNISKRIPKTINEAINFNEYDDDEYGDDGFEDEYSDDKYNNSKIGTGQNFGDVDDLNVDDFINDTRKKSLQIMAKLADEPENKTYEIAKRIWQICDKSLADEKAENENSERPRPTR